MSLKKLYFLLLIVPLMIGVIYFSRVVIIPFIFAFFLAYALNPIVEFLQRKGARRDFAIITLYLVMFILTAMAVELILPLLVRDLTIMIQRLPSIFASFQMIEAKFVKILNRWQLPFNLDFIINEFTQRGEAIIRNSLVQLGDGLVNLFSKSLLYVLVPLLAYYISRDYPRIKHQTYQWILKNFGNHWTRTFLKIDSVFRYYIRGQLLDTLIVGTLFAIGLTILGFEASILLGFIAGLFNLIPYFGPILGVMPLIFFALLKSPWLVLYVIILFFIINQLEVMFLAPRIIGTNLGLSPVFIIYLILLGGEIFGLVGMIFAVPLGAIFLILLKSLYQTCFGLANHEPIPEKPDFNLSELD